MPIPDQRKPKVELTELKLGENSTVDAGDNPPALIALVKREGAEDASPGAGGDAAPVDKGPAPADPPAATPVVVAPAPEPSAPTFWDRMKRWVSKDHFGSMPRTTNQIIASEEFEQGFFKLRMAFLQSVDSILESAPIDELAGMLADTGTQFAEKARALSDAASVDAAKRAELDVILGILETPVGAELAKREGFMAAVRRLDEFNFGAQASEGDAAPSTKEEEMPVTLAEAMKALDGKGIDANAMQTIKAALFDKAAAFTGGEQTADKAAAPAAPVAVGGVDIAAIVKAAVAESTKGMAEELTQLRKVQKTNTYLAKAKELRVPGREFDSIAKQLEAAYGVSEDNGKELEATLKGLTAQVAQSSNMTKQIGRALGVDDQPGSAEQALAKHGAEIRKTVTKEVNGVQVRLTKEQAEAQAVKEHPELYNQYLDEHPHQTAMGGGVVFATDD